MGIELMAMAVITPFLTITAFVIGYNINADRKILVKKTKKTKEAKANEDLMERIDKATVY